MRSQVLHRAAQDSLLTMWTKQQSADAPQQTTQIAYGTLKNHKPPGVPAAQTKHASQTDLLAPCLGTS